MSNTHNSSSTDVHPTFSEGYTIKRVNGVGMTLSGFITQPPLLTSEVIRRLLGGTLPPELVERVLREARSYMTKSGATRVLYSQFLSKELVEQILLDRQEIEDYGLDEDSPLLDVILNLAHSERVGAQSACLNFSAFDVHTRYTIYNKLCEGYFLPFQAGEYWIDSDMCGHTTREGAYTAEASLGDCSDRCYFFSFESEPTYVDAVLHPASSSLPTRQVQSHGGTRSSSHHRVPSRRHYGKKVRRVDTYIEPTSRPIELNSTDAGSYGPISGPCSVAFKPKGLDYYGSNGWKLDEITARAVIKACNVKEGLWKQQFERLFPNASDDLKLVYYHARLAVGRVFAQRLTRRVQVRAQEAVSKERHPHGPQLRDGPRRTERREREERQRKLAKEKRQAAWKSKPKREREAEVKSTRDKRNPIYLQSGFRPRRRDAVVVGATLVGAKVIRAFIKQARKIGRSIESVDQAANSISEFFTNLKNVADQIGAQLGEAFKFVPLTLMSYYILRYTAGVSDALIAALTAMVAQFVGKRVWNHISKFFHARDVESQSGFNADFAAQAGGLLTSLFACQALAGKHPRAADEFMKRVANFPKMAQGVEGFLTWMVKALEVLVNKLFTMFGKQRVQLYNDVYANVNEWKRRVDVVCAEDIISGAPTTEQLDNMINLIREGYAFKEVYRTTKVAQGIEQTLGKITSALMPYQGALSSRNNFRFEPSSLFLTGLPGIGKTLLAMPLCATILLESGILASGSNFSEVAKQIWQKGNSEYWNGYAGQACLVMDDVFQSRVNGTSSDNDYMNIIRMVSSWSFPLNFADLASKGKIYFGSKFIYATTNLESIYSEASKVLNEPEAVLRRINHPYKLIVAPEYSTAGGKLDYDKFAAEKNKCAEATTHLDLFPWHIWRVVRHDFATGQSSGPEMPLRGLIDTVIRDLKTRMQTHDVARSGLEDYVSRLNKFMEKSSGGSKAEHHTQPKAPLAENGLLARSNYCTDLPTEHCTQPEVPLAEGALLTRSNNCTELQGGFLRSVRGVANGITRILWRMHGANMATGDMEEGFEERRAGEYMRAMKRDLDIRKHIYTQKEALGEPGEIYKTICATSGLLFTLFTSHLIWVGVEILCSTIWHVLTRIVGMFMPKKKPEKQSNRPDGRRKAQLQSADDTIATNVYNNTYKMYVRRHGGSEPVGQVLFLMHGLAVQPLHFTQDLREMLAKGKLEANSIIGFRNSGNPQHVITFTVEHYLTFKRVVHEDRELEFVDFGSIRAHRNIIKNFLTAKQIQSVGGKIGRLDICHIGDGDIDKNTRTVYTCQNLQCGKDLMAGSKRIKEYVQYRAPTMSGDCGAPLCLLNHESFSGRSCFGIHVAGRPNDSIGYAAIVTQELVREAVDQLLIVKDAFEPDLLNRVDGIELQSSNMLPFATHGSFMPLYVTDKPATICPKSSFKPTELMGRFGRQDNLPAHLAPVKVDGKLVYPMDNAVASYASPLRIYEHKWMRQALHVAMRPLTQLTMGHTRAIFTFEEAVLGLPEQKFRSIPRGTAAGYPYTLTMRDGKKGFFGETDMYDLTSDECAALRKRVEYVIQCARKNIRLCHIFTDFLKDEIRPRAKVEAVATRLISSAPLDYVVAFRQYFGAFSSAVMLNHTESGLAPGICTYSDWDVLATKLRSRGPSCFDGDFKQFDASEQPCVHDLVLDFINQWYNDGEENARVRRVLWLELTHSRHIGGTGFDQRHIYQWAKSLPSGHPFTTIINSIYSLFMLVSAYIYCTGDRTGFWDYVYAAVYGDDNVVNVDDRILDKFNQIRVAGAIMTLFAVTYTASDKSGRLTGSKTLAELSFLKRGFAEEGARWLCPLEFESFLYTSYWCKNQKLKDKIIEDVLEMALEELSLHPAEQWDSIAPMIGEVMNERGQVPKCPLDRKSYQDLVLSRTDNWY